MIAGRAAALAAAMALSNPVAPFDELTKPPASAASPGARVRGQPHRQRPGHGPRPVLGVRRWTRSRPVPLHGIGAGGYEAWWAEHGSLSYYVRDAHSLFLEQLAELGLAGLVLVAALFVAAFAAGRRRRSRAGPSARPGWRSAWRCWPAAPPPAALDWTWELPAAFGPVVLVAALLVGPATALPGIDQRTPGGYGWGVATLAVAWIALVVAATVALMGEVQLGDSRQAARQGDLAEAGTAAATAARVQPWASTPRLQEALVAERGATSAAPWRPTRRRWTAPSATGGCGSPRPACGPRRATSARPAGRSPARATLNPRSPIFAGALMRGHTSVGDPGSLKALDATAQSHSARAPSAERSRRARSRCSAGEGRGRTPCAAGCWHSPTSSRRCWHRLRWPVLGGRPRPRPSGRRRWYRHGWCWPRRAGSTTRTT